jgi:hypothetical protein
MNRNDLKAYFRTLVESTTKEQNKRSMLNEGDDKPPLVSPNLKRISQMMANRPDSYEDEDPAYASQFGSHLDEEEDVEELARYDALNDDVDATLYRDNPDYRRVFKATLLNPVRDAVDSERRSMEKVNARRMGIEPDLRWDYSDDEADMSDEYRRMTLSPDRAYDK